jgi:electron transfer flavoprotein beta subunit
VVCGAWSVDRGSGSVPAYLAAHLAAAQALGLVSITIEARALRAERRLDGGRRERLRVPVPAVVSVEGGSARLRRAPLDGVLRAGATTIDIRPTVPARRHDRPVRVAPFRPRPRALPPPVGKTARERVLGLTGAMVERRAAQTLFLPPPEAAREIIDRLQAWGYLP